LRFPGETTDGNPLVVTITMMAETRDRLHWRCNRCARACEHIGAAFSLILEEKMVLGLAEKPKPRTPIESLAENTGGELLGAAFRLLGELVSPTTAAAPSEELVSTIRAGLNACVESGDGPPRLTISLPDRGALDGLAQSLARLLAAGGTAPAT
jgi:hypothetical protein